MGARRQDHNQIEWLIMYTYDQYIQYMINWAVVKSYIRVKIH